LASVVYSPGSVIVWVLIYFCHWGIGGVDLEYWRTLEEGGLRRGLLSVVVGNENDNDSNNEVGMTTMMGVCLILDPTCNQSSV